MPTLKKPIFDIVGTNQAGEPVLVEVQQNASQIFIDLMEEKPFLEDILQNEMYAKERSYLDGIRDTAKRMIADGKLSNEDIAAYSGLSVEDIVVLRSQAET